MDEMILKRLETLEKQVSLLNDKQKIENLMSKHNFYFSAGHGREIVPQLWTSDKKASIEYGASGVYGELWKVITFYVNFDVPGCFKTFTSANSHITVADDGQTAKGAWMVIGTETDAGELSSAGLAENDERRILLSSQTEDGKVYRAEVLLQSHEAYFVKENGEWKIHDLHISEYFRCPAGKDWVQYAKQRQTTDGMWLESMFETPDPIPSWENIPSGETTCHWQYDVDARPCDMALPEQL